MSVNAGPLLLAAVDDGLVAQLGELLRDSVAGGASVNFVQVPTIEEARSYWSDLLSRPEISTWIQTDQHGVLLGTVSLVRATQENSPHRGEVIKLLVHSRARGKGIARRLMSTMEESAVADGRTLLILDTETGSPAEALYERWGWTRVGVIPGFALDVRGGPSGSTIFYKTLPFTRHCAVPVPE